MANLGDADLFTRLTTILIVNILSFLPIKDAARTSVLSKRWYKIWCSSCNIEFNETFFIKPDETEEKTEEKRKGFVDFTRKLIENYNQDSVNAVLVKIFNPEKYFSVINECIGFATLKKVRQLVLDFSGANWDEEDIETIQDPKFVLPSFVYQNRVMESLRLFSCKFDVSRLKDFSALKEISLGWIDLDSDKITALLANCPFLEVFSLKSCWNFNVLQISSANTRLRSLIIDKCHFTDAYLEIEAPNLELFKYSGKIPMVHFSSIRSLKSVDLDFGLEFQLGDISELLYNMLIEIPPAEVLSVCSYLLRVLPSAEERIQFDVRHLILKTRLHGNEFRGIKLLLENSPLLKILTIRLGHSRDNQRQALDPKKFWKGSQAVYHCLAKTLKIVEVENFKGEENEICFLNYLIKLGKVLECMKLKIFKDKDAQLMLQCMQKAEEVQALRRASPGLSIEVTVVGTRDDVE